MTDAFETEIIDQASERETREVSAFMAPFGLEYEGGLDYGLALRQGGKIVAAGFFKGEILRNIAVDEGLQGRGLTAALLGALMGEQARRGIVHYFIATRPEKASLFSALGFTEIARAEPHAALLESGLGGLGAWCGETARELAGLAPRRAALVMNCNPFTRGHEALIRRAAAENEAVVVFVVSEDRSLFPLADRLRLVREGVGDLPAVRVLPSGKYMISEATFPAYFLKEEERAMAQASLDNTLFAEKLAPALNIVRRYVGEEPACPVTRAYNEAMLAILPGRGVEVRLMPRVRTRGEPISASAVRAAWLAGDWARVGAMAPGHTLAYLKTRKKP